MKLRISLLSTLLILTPLLKFYNINNNIKIDVIDINIFNVNIHLDTIIINIITKNIKK